MNDHATFDHFRVCSRPDGTPWELGRGSMGVTYKATDVNLECLVALKVINTESFEEEILRQRFVREARTAALLRHPNIATVYHLRASGGQFFYAMEFVEGENAKALVEQMGPMSPEMALQIALQTASALGEAGRRGLVHRDIKPANIMIARERDDHGWPVVKVIDFGLVRSILGGGESRGFVGTPLYASPEQAEERELDSRSDIYSLGCSLWFLLTGHPPFSGSVANVFIQHLTREPPWEQLRGVPPAVQALLRRMLAKKRERRFRDPAELRGHIEVCLHRLSQRRALIERVSRPATLAERWVAGQFKEHGGAWALGAGLAMLMIFSAFLGKDADKPRHVGAKRSAAAGQAHAWVSRLAATENAARSGTLPVVAQGPIPPIAGLPVTEATGAGAGVRETATPSPLIKPLPVIETVGTPPPKGPAELAESGSVAPRRIAPDEHDVAISASPAHAEETTASGPEAATAVSEPTSKPEIDNAVNPALASVESDNTAPPRGTSAPAQPANVNAPGPENRGSAVAGSDGTKGTAGFHTPAPEDTRKSHKPRHRSSSEDRSIVPSITHIPHRITRFIGRFL